MSAAAPPPDLTPAQAQAMADYFGGDRSLFERYCAMCRQQFAQDLLAGDAAAAQADMARLQHLAHNLKTVLRTLGDAAASTQAGALEQASQGGDAAMAQTIWATLRQQLSSSA